MDDYWKKREAEEAKYKNWLNALKPGDMWEAVQRGNWGSTVATYSVVRRTKTQLVVSSSAGSEQRFRADTGAKLGRVFDRLPAPAAAEELQAAHKEMRTRVLARALDRVRWGDTALEKLEQIAEILKLGCR